MTSARTTKTHTSNAANGIAEVSWDADHDAYRVSGFTEAAGMLRGEGWSSDPRHSPLVAPDIRDMPTGNPLVTDPPDHTRLRGLLSPTFTPRAINNLRPRIATIVETVLDGLPELADEDSSGAIDIVADLAYPITLAATAELLDIGIEGAQVFADHTPSLVRIPESTPPTTTCWPARSPAPSSPHFSPRSTPNAASAPAPASSPPYQPCTTTPDGLSLQEVLATCVLPLVAGHETTANLIANSTLALLTHPDQATEELLRLHGSAKLIARTALTDHDLSGRHITAGQAIIIDLHAANRDPHHLPNPERLDRTRAPTGHLAFGAGAHCCLDAALARLHTTVTLTRLFTRLWFPPSPGHRVMRLVSRGGCGGDGSAVPIPVG